MFAEHKDAIIKKYAQHERDTGSPEVQIAILSDRISHLTEHFKIHKHDHHGRRGLLTLVARRRALLGYLKRENGTRYKAVVDSLGLRK